MRVLFIITTRYHMGCALDIFARYDQGACCDIAVIGGGLKKDAKLLAEAAKFMRGEIVLCTEESGKLNKTRDLAFLFYRLLFNPRKNFYDQIVVFSPSLISARYRLENPNAKVYLGEDGTGSYSGLILKRFAYFDYSLHSDSKLAKLIRSVFKSKMDLNASGIYVYQPEAVKYNYPFPIKKISRTAKTNEIIRHSMSGGDENKRSTRAVFLGQYYNEIGINATDMIEVFEASKILIKEFTYRRHPRDRWIPQNIELEESKDWELLCETVSEDSIFISLGSTALQSPKYLYDKEPYLVFTYKLHPEIPEEFSQSFDIFAKSLKQLYRKRNKVFVAEDLDDYVSILNSIKKENSLES